MNEKFKQNPFIKDPDNLEMFKQCLKSKGIDQDIRPILKRFFSLPITPTNSCYGHPETNKSPYLSYVNDETKNKKELSIQKNFKEKITELTTRINKKIGTETVNVSLEGIDRGGGPIEYTLDFEIIDEKSFKKTGNKILEIIWKEFSKYIDELK